jgi:hypothetical protein
MCLVKNGIMLFATHGMEWSFDISVVLILIFCRR